MHVTHLAAAIASLALAATGASADDLVKLYGPGGPAPAMTAAAKAYSEANGIKVEVVAGPTGKWAEDAAKDADIIFSGAENMLPGYATAMPGLFDMAEARPIYLRPSAILVRKGNPEGITGFADLLKPDMKVMTVGGAGQTGLWEDIAGRAGRIADVQALRTNLIFPEPPNSAAAKDVWASDQSIDAWLIWNIWQIANPDVADLVEIEPEYRIYRPVSVVTTIHSDDDADAFIAFLTSTEGQRIFSQYGWETGQ